MGIAWWMVEPDLAPVMQEGQQKGKIRLERLYALLLVNTSLYVRHYN